MKNTDKSLLTMPNASNPDTTLIRLTQYSHGAGCGCKIAPQLLDEILVSSLVLPDDDKLLVGNDTRDDAAVYDIGNGQAVISTTDFFMPIVDDPATFGRIAATNAISDVYAMGGKPLMAIAILGWPVDKLSAAVASQVVDGGRAACKDAGILLAGGHSIDSPEPIFGLAVTGIVNIDQLKRNDTATAGCQLFLTKPIGIGIHTSAEKNNALKNEHCGLAAKTMCQLNSIGETLGQLDSVTAMTDVTGFGLLGHLTELCEGSGVCATVHYTNVPLLPDLEYYIDKGCSPGGAQRNYDSYHNKISKLTDYQRKILCDPQTSGGLLLAVKENEIAAFYEMTQGLGLSLKEIGMLSQCAPDKPLITVS